MNKTRPVARSPLPEKDKPAATGNGQRETDNALEGSLPPIDELLAEFDSGKVPRSETWHTLITGLYFNFDSVNEIEGWYNTVQELTSFNQELSQTINAHHNQIEIWYGQIDIWQQQVADHTQQAAASASAAQASETASASSASNAASSENTVTQQATAAEASATQARASETASANSASQAQGSASLAGSSASDALNSANNAKASETAAQQATSNAQTAEQNAQESASQAGASETAAAGFASTATQQADRSESEADRAKSEADRVIASSARIVGEICRFSFDTPPVGFFALDGSRISNGVNDFSALANCGSRFITISGSDLVLANFQDFGRGKGASGRSVGSFEGDAIRNIIAGHGSGGNYGFDVFHDVTGGANYTEYNSHTGWRVNTVSGQPLSDGKRNWINFDASRVVPTASENRPKSLTELVCIYHGVL